jgi:hypothetical protein
MVPIGYGHVGGVMQKLLVFALAGAAVALALSGSFASGATSSDDDQTQRIVVVSTLTSFNFVDVGPQGVSPGDETTFTKTFKDTGGTVVGFGHGSCVVITVDRQGNPTSAECQITTRFGHSTIETAGVDHLIEPQTFAIVGGTGRFRGADGQVIAGGGPGGADVYEVES